MAAMDSGGSIVNMLSAAMDVPAEGLAAYATSKAALAQLTKTLALEVGQDGIRVNAVAPGWIETPMTVAANFRDSGGRVDESARAATIAQHRARSPLAAIGEPVDIAHAVLFLSSPASRFITGQTLRVNGGITMP